MISALIFILNKGLQQLNLDILPGLHCKWAATVRVVEHMKTRQRTTVRNSGLAQLKVSEYKGGKGTELQKRANCANILVLIFSGRC